MFNFSLFVFVEYHTLNSLDITCQTNTLILFVLALLKLYGYNSEDWFYLLETGLKFHHLFTLFLQHKQAVEGMGGRWCVFLGYTKDMYLQKTYHKVKYWGIEI